MAPYDNSYSRFVAWIKILLPLFALGLLSTLFLLSHKIDPSKAIPYAKVDVKELAREQRIKSPDYATVTSDGTAISITADQARPDPQNPGSMSADTLHATFETSGGMRIDIVAGKGKFNADAQTARLQDGVKLDTSTGYHLKTSAVTANLGKTYVISDGPVTGDGPLGHLNAGQMVLRQAASDKSVYVLVFKNGIKLIYDPKK